MPKGRLCLMVWRSQAWAGRQEAPQSPPFPSLLERKPEGEDPTQKTFVPNLRHFQLYHVFNSHTQLNEYFMESLQC